MSQIIANLIGICSNCNTKSNELYKVSSDGEAKEISLCPKCMMELQKKIRRQMAKDIRKKKSEILQLSDAMFELENAWGKVSDAISNFDTLDINDFVCGVDGKEGTEYPFDKSFDEITVYGWIEGVRELLQSALNNISDLEKEMKQQ